MRTSLSLVLASACLFAPAVGQVQVRASFVSVAQLKVVALSTQNVPVQKTAPANTDLSKGVTLEASTHGGQATFKTALNGWSGIGWAAYVRDSAASVYPVGYSGGSGTSGPNRSLLTFTTNKTVPVRVIVTLKATANHLATVDIGADGKVEFTGSVGATRREFAAVVDVKKGLKIQLMTGAATAGKLASSFSGELLVEVRPRCEAVEYGKGCGAKPTATIDPGFDDTITFRLSNALPLTTAVLGVGTQQINVPLPSLPALGSPCPLRTDLVVMVFGKTDPFGIYQTRVTVPNSLKLSVNAQMFTVAPFGNSVDIRSTAAFRVTCK